MKKIVVDQDRCIGCGACVGIASDTFEFNEDGLSIVKNDEVTEEATDAMNSCPVDAISIEEDKNN